MKIKIAVCVSLCVLCPRLLAQESQARESEVLVLEETIRGNQEQPKVLTIVPWQPPTTKQALPSQIVERINKKFVPLQRDEMLRELDILERQSLYQER